MTTSTAAASQVQLFSKLLWVRAERYVDARLCKEGKVQFVEVLPLCDWVAWIEAEDWRRAN